MTGSQLSPVIFTKNTTDTIGNEKDAGMLLEKGGDNTISLSLLSVNSWSPPLSLSFITSEIAEEEEEEEEKR